MTGTCLCSRTTLTLVTLFFFIFSTVCTVGSREHKAYMWQRRSWALCRALRHGLEALAGSDFRCSRSDYGEKLLSYSLDTVVAIELRIDLQRNFWRNLPISEFPTSITVDDLAESFFRRQRQSWNVSEMIRGPVRQFFDQ
ncbi:hypothetical protein N657DRAFT_245404 [Parathielavia appendiculata]|uniref:Uncharacterized protein n=1 Tax=Parathielavia appendiculata TaxID=2587402 RepID=A0AAN6YZB5_9PEZI|nr:hypothetical protein N657DRAFT_245404 [Parathielavia appendiculata]